MFFFKKKSFFKIGMWPSRPPRDPPPLHGKYHLKFPFWLLAPFPKQKHLLLNAWQFLFIRSKSLNSILILFSRPPPDPQRRSVGNIFPPLSAKLFCHPHKWTHITTLSPCSDQERQQCNLFQFLLQCTWSWRVGITGRVAVVTLTIATLKYFRQFGRKPQS